MWFRHDSHQTCQLRICDMAAVQGHRTQKRLLRRRLHRSHGVQSELPEERRLRPRFCRTSPHFGRSSGVLRKPIGLVMTKRVDLKSILSDPKKRRALLTRCIVATQAREGVITTIEQAEAAYEKICRLQQRCHFMILKGRRR